MSTASISNSADQTIASHQILEMIELGQMQQALALADELLASCHKERHCYLLALKGRVLSLMGNAIEGLRVSITAHELAVHLGNRQLMCEVQQSMGFALQSLDDHARAIEVFSDAQVLAAAENSDELFARATKSIGVSYSVLGHHEQAQELLNDAVNVLRTKGSKAEWFNARYAALEASTHAIDSLPNEPLSRHSQLLQLRAKWHAFAQEATDSNLPRLALMGQTNEAKFTEKLGEFSQALEVFESIAERHASNELAQDEAIAQSHIGKILLELKRPQEAINSFSRAIELLQSNNPRACREAWDALSDAYEAIDDPRSALVAIKQAREIERQLHGDNTRAASKAKERQDEIALMSAQWSRLTNEDSLTGLASRRAFDRKLGVMTDNARTGHHFCLIMFDLDFFKQINDTFGHATGDIVLQDFSRLLHHSRAEDLAARIGGEEFALILATDKKLKAVEVAQRIREAVTQHLWGQIRRGLKVTVSISVLSSAELDPRYITAQEIFTAANKRLLAAKRAGSNQVCFSG